MINHSELTKYVVSRLGTGIIPTEILRMTSDGVVKEAGPLVGATLAKPVLPRVTPDLTPIAEPKHKLGAKSRENLMGVKMELASCAEFAIGVSSQDFTVFEGARTIERQRQLVKDKLSRTMNSKHIPDANGVVRAIDLVPWIKGKPVWDWNGCADICIAMIEAANHYKCLDNIRWGAAWDRTLGDFVRANDYRTRDAIMRQVGAYRERHAGPDFIDGPHYEWVA